MSPERAPQSKPARTALSTFSAFHKVDHIRGQRRGLAIAEGFAREKARRAVTPQIGNEHPVAGRCKGVTSTKLRMS
jgi:hypothetical protein